MASTIRTGGGTPGGHPRGSGCTVRPAIGSNGCWCAMRPRHPGRRAPQPRETPSLILGVECTFERSSTHSHTPGVQAAKPKWRRAPQAGRPLRDGPRGQGTKPPQADAPSTGPRCIKATPRQTDAAGHHSHRGRKGRCSHILKQGPGNPFRDDGKTARQLRGGRTNRYGDLWRRDGRGAPPRGLGHSTRQTTANSRGCSGASPITTQ